MKANFQQQLLQHGSHLGHKSVKIGFRQASHPSMIKFLLGIRKTIHIIDPNFTVQYLIKALSVLYSIALSGGTVLIVNTNPEYVHFLQSFFKNVKKNNLVAFIDSVWIGGTLTNWKQLSKSIYTYSEFSKKFDYFLHKNNIYFPRYKKMKKSFQGLVDTSAIHQNFFLKKKPDVIFIINPNENINLLEEAKSLNIPVIAITNSNTDLSKITYPIPSNDHSFYFLFHCLKWIIKITR